MTETCHWPKLVDGSLAWYSIIASLDRDKSLNISSPMPNSGLYSTPKLCALAMIANMLLCGTCTLFQFLQHWGLKFNRGTLFGKQSHQLKNPHCLVKKFCDNLRWLVSPSSKATGENIFEEVDEFRIWSLCVLVSEVLIFFVRKVVEMLVSAVDLSWGGNCQRDPHIRILDWRQVLAILKWRQEWSWRRGATGEGWGTYWWQQKGETSGKENRGDKQIICEWRWKVEC